MVTVSAARSIIGAAPSPHPSPSLLLLEKINQLNTIIYLPVSRTDQAHCDWIMQMSTSIISNGLWIDLCLRGGGEGGVQFLADSLWCPTINWSHGNDTSRWELIERHQKSTQIIKTKACDRHTHTHTHFDSVVEIDARDEFASIALTFEVIGSKARAERWSNAALLQSPLGKTCRNCAVMEWEASQSPVSRWRCNRRSFNCHPIGISIFCPGEIPTRSAWNTAVNQAGLWRDISLPRGPGGHH